MLPHHLVTLTCTGLASRTFQAVLSAASWSCVLAHFLFLFQDNVLNIINQIMDVCIPRTAPHGISVSSSPRRSGTTTWPASSGLAPR